MKNHKEPMEANQSLLNEPLTVYPQLNTLVNFSRGKTPFGETLVDDLFHSLEIAYRAESDNWVHLDPLAKLSEQRLSERLVLPVHLLRLLPISGEWIYHPCWYKPQRTELMSWRTQQRLADFRVLAATLVRSKELHDIGRELYWLEREITQRAAVYSFNHLNKQLLKGAIDEAKTHLLSFALQASGAEKMTRTQTSLMASRLDWLEKWLLADRERRRWLVGTTKVAKGNITRLIQPSDVEQAIDLFGYLEHAWAGDAINTGSAKQNLGLWYVDMLLKCGANWHDLRPPTSYRKLSASLSRGEPPLVRLAEIWGGVLYLRGSVLDNYKISDVYMDRAELGKVRIKNNSKRNNPY